jgi:nucleoside-diphosphate-sugar epimerase
MSRVLVTGGSGFVGGHVILQLLAAGHQVRTTVRDLRREGEVRAMVKEGGADAGANLSFVAADLSGDAGWLEAVAGCEYVLHVASPIPLLAPEHEDELIVPAREGALRVLRVSRDAGVRRVVVTSSCGAIYYGLPLRKAPFTEADWSDLNGGDMSAYVKSKILAERAAWDFMDREGGNLEMSVINPAGIFGPVLGAYCPSSVNVLKRLMDGMPGCPQISFGIVDVRDVADLHLRAMVQPAAKGQRFIAVGGKSMSMLDISKVLRRRMGAAAQRAPRLQLPNWLVRLAARRDPAMRPLLPMLGKVREASHEKATRLLGWKPRPNEDTLVATAESLVRFGLLKQRS